jgi:hypothetical protein
MRGIIKCLAISVQDKENPQSVFFAQRLAFHTGTVIFSPDPALGLSLVGSMGLMLQLELPVFLKAIWITLGSYFWLPSTPAQGAGMELETVLPFVCFSMFSSSFLPLLS